MKRKLVWIYDDVYRQDVLVVFTSSHKKFCEIVKKEINWEPDDKGEVPPGVCGETYLVEKKGDCLIVVWTCNDNDTLLHELFHVASKVLSGRGIWLNPETDESYAYYFCYLVRAVKDQLNCKEDNG